MSHICISLRFKITVTQKTAVNGNMIGAPKMQNNYYIASCKVIVYNLFCFLFWYLFFASILDYESQGRWQLFIIIFAIDFKSIKECKFLLSQQLKEQYLYGEQFIKKKGHEPFYKTKSFCILEASIIFSSIVN